MSQCYSIQVKLQTTLSDKETVLRVSEVYLGKIFLIEIIFICVCVCVYLLVHVCIKFPLGPEEGIGSLELEFAL